MPAPLKTFRSTIAPGVQISVWNGEKGSNFSIKKSYKNKEGQWIDSTTFYPADLAALGQCINQALAFADALRYERGEQVTSESEYVPYKERKDDLPKQQSFKDDDDIPF